MINEAMAAQRADVDTVKARRGQKFVIEDTKPYVNVARKMTAIGGPEARRSSISTKTR